MGGLQAGRTAAGRSLLGQAFRSCHPLRSEGDVLALMEKGQGPWFEMAEGNCESHPILRAPRICRAILFCVCKYVCL